MAYLFQDFSVGQVLTAVHLDQLEENILKHEHGVTTNCQVLSLYGTLSENESVTGLWSFANILRLSGGRDTYIDYADDPDYCNIFRTGASAGDFSSEAGHLVIQARVHNTVYRDIIFAGGQPTGNEIMRIFGEGIVTIGGAVSGVGCKLNVVASGNNHVSWENSSYALGLLGYGSDSNRGKITLYSGGTSKTTISAEDTGTAPITVASTTVCTNLNADMVDGLHSTDFVRSNMSVVRAKRITSSDSLPDATLTTIIYNSEDFDSGNEHDTATGIFTATNAGYYAISAGANISSGNTITYRAIVILKNSTIIAAKGDYDSVPASTTNDMNVSAMIYLAASDTLKVQVTQTSGSSGNINNSEKTFMSIHRIK